MDHEGPNVSRDQKEKELAQLALLHDDANGDQKPTRRRLQNRFAQRAFRARTKENKQEVNSRRIHLLIPRKIFTGMRWKALSLHKMNKSEA